MEKRHLYPDHAAVVLVATLILGGLSLPLSLCVGVGALPGLTAFVLGIPGLRSSRYYGMAIAGLVGGLLSVPLSLLMLAILFNPGRT